MESKGDTFFFFVRILLRSKNLLSPLRRGGCFPFGSDIFDLVKVQ
jgi:hypothetical protein